MIPLLLVMLGGAFGAGGRYLLGVALFRLTGPGLPWGTLSANLLGGFLMGCLAGALARAGVAAEPWRLFLGVGVLGGFTTFSSFSLEVVNMIERGDWAVALGYALASAAGAIVALFLGLAAVRAAA